MFREKKPYKSSIYAGCGAYVVTLPVPALKELNFLYRRIRAKHGRPNWVASFEGWWWC
jgi:hypothetical protein